MSHPSEFEIAQERVRKALGEYEQTCAAAEAWYLDLRAGRRQGASMDNMEGSR